MDTEGIRFKIRKIKFRRIKRIKPNLRGGRRAARAVTRTAARTSRSITRAIDRLPVVGHPLSLVYGATLSAPLALANSIAQGARIDRAALGYLRDQLRRVRQLAPYAQAVVTLVPGVGQGLGATIGAGVALYDGRPLSTALVEGIRGALPGGPAARMAFDLGRAALSGQRLDDRTLAQATVGAMNLSPAQRRLMLQGLSVARDVARGKRADQAVFDRAQRLLPPEARKALTVGIAVAQGQRLQGAVTRAVGPRALARLQRIGSLVTSKSGVLRAGRRVLRGADQRSGYAIGAGLVAHRSGAFDLRAVRAKLRPRQRVGFDLAVSAYRGLAKKRAPAPPPKMRARSRFGYYAALGLKAISRKRRPAVAAAIARSRLARLGAAAALRQRARIDPAMTKIFRPEDLGFDELFAASNRWEQGRAQQFFNDLVGAAR